MRRSRVVVLYTHPLFGQGIGRLLRADKKLDVTCLLASGDGAREELRRLHPDAIVLESSTDDVLWESLHDQPPLLVVRVGLDENTLDIYERHQILATCPESLSHAIHSGLENRPG